MNCRVQHGIILIKPILSQKDTVFPQIVSAETIFFFNLEIQRSQYIRPKVTVHKSRIKENHGISILRGKLFRNLNSVSTPPLLNSFSNTPMLLTKTCYYIENQGFGGVTTRDMSLIETCFCSRLYGIYYFFFNNFHIIMQWKK